MPNQIPAYLASLFNPIPSQYQQGYGGGIPAGLQSLLAYLTAHASDQDQGGQPDEPSPRDIYQGQISRELSPPSPMGLSPIGRFNDMVLRQSASLANRAKDGREAVKSSLDESNERQRLVDSITHPPPTSPYTITTGKYQEIPEPGSMQPANLKSRYGTGSVSFAPPGTEIHGRFGPEGLQFGQIGGADEAQPTSGDPMQTTYQQQMMLDAIHKTLGKKKR